MNIRVALTTFLIICAASSVCVAQGQSAPESRNPVISDPKVDEYGNIPWKDERRRLDWMAEVLESSPASIIYLAVYDGQGGCVGEARRRAARAKNYLVRVII
jgi:hypothetical protein